MNFTISDPTGLFTLPFLITMAENAYNLMNELGLIFIPFTFVIVQSFFDSRSQGADEGAEAVIFVKLIESRFIPMFLILLLAVMPVTDSVSPNFKYRAYQCTDAPSILVALDSVEDLRPNTNYANLYGNSNPSMLFGIVNEIGAAINGVGIGSLNCEAGINRNEVGEILSKIEVHKAIRAKALKEFDKQCYTKAVGSINRLESNNDTLNVDFNSAPYNSIDSLAYDSPALIKMYNGTITSPMRDPMLFIVPDYWDEIETGVGETATCEYISSTITNEIKTDLYATSAFSVTGDFNSMASRVYKTINTPNGANFTLSDAVQEMTRASYRNTATSWYNPLMKRASIEKTPTVETRAVVNNQAVNSTTSYNTSYSSPSYQQPTQGGITNSAVSGLAYFGAMWSNLTKSIETLTYLRITPVILTIMQGCILAFGGIVLLLSGYNSRVLLHLALFYFSLSLVPFFMNVGVIFDNVITGLVENKSNGLNISNSSVIEIVNLAGTTLIILCPLAWLTLVQLLGIHVTNTMDLAGAGNASKTTANMGVQKVMQTMNSGISSGKREIRKTTDQKNKALKKKVDSILTRIANES